MQINSYSQHQITNDDKAAVLEALDHQFLSGGELVEKFEQELAAYTGAEYAVICNSGTSALYMAYRALEIKNMVTSPITYAATVNAAKMMGASVGFFDVDDSGLLEIGNGGADLLVPVHLNGNSCDMEAIRRKWAGYIVEDACHALGGHYKGRKIGSCEFSDMCVFSFHPLKTITTGEGGAITTNDSSLYRKLKALVQNGIAGNLRTTYSGNFRMPAFNAALGSSQLKRADENVRKRKELVNSYDLPAVAHQEGSACHLYVVQSDKRDEIKQRLEENNVPCRVHYRPLYDLANAARYYERSLSIPLYPTLTKQEQEFVRSLCL